jgi:hypothetical protein
VTIPDAGRATLELADPAQANLQLILVTELDESSGAGAR